MISLTPVEIHTELKPVESIMAKLELPELVTRDVATMGPYVPERFAWQWIP
jgi:hypothetical protein